MSNNDEYLLGGSPQALLQRLPARVTDCLTQRALTAPASNAVRDQHGRQLTYQELADAVQQAALQLRQLGVQPRDRVVLVNENCVPLLILVLALSKLDAWPVVVNARMAADEIERIRVHCEPRLVVYLLDSAAARDHWRQLLAEVDCQERELAGACLGVRALPVSAAIDVSGDEYRDVFTLIYTTGTTGAPKGVMLTHRNALYVAAVSGALRGLRSDDRIYLVLPVSHIFGLSAVFLAALYAGAELVVADRFDAAETLRIITEDGVTGLFGVPTMYARLVEHLRSDPEHLPRQPGQPLAALRFMYVGGAPLDPTIKQQTEAAFGLPLLNGYGMTESSPTLCQVRYNEPLAHCGVGRPLPGLEVRILDPEGRPVEPGDTGELHVRGPNIMLGYFRNPGATAEVISADGYLNTGDLVRQDTDGNLHLVGRSKELIIHSGFNVYPPEVEAVIARHPEVLMCAVVGEAIAGNEQVVAWVQPIRGSTLNEAELAAFLKPLLAPYKRPARIIMTEALPTAPSGKVLKHRLGAAGLPEMH